MMNDRRQHLGKNFLFEAVRRPATEALETIGSCEGSTSSKGDDEIHRRRPMINFASQKRHHSEIGTFDMSAIEQASKKVENAIAFPTIEWPTYEGDDETDSEDFPQPQAKRPRFGLVRSAPSFNLVALASAERLESDDSLY